MPAETTPQKSDATKALFDAVDQMAKIKDRWENSDIDEITEGFRDGVLDLADAFEQNDIPRECRELAIAVFAWLDQWAAFERDLTSEPIPTAKFWRHYNEMIRLREAGPRRFRRLEPVALLVNVQKVSVNQVAKIYGWFLPNGSPDEAKVYEELTTPGTHVGPDFVPPEEREWEQQSKRDVTARRERIRKYIETTRDEEREAPESLEELIRQRVPAKQTAKMKHTSIDAVLAKAKELGIVLPDENEHLRPGSSQWDDTSERAEAARNSVGRGAQQPPAGDQPESETKPRLRGRPRKAPAGDMPDADDGAGDSSRAADERLTAEIVRLHEAGEKNADIARRFGVSKGRVASAIRSTVPPDDDGDDDDGGDGDDI